MFLWYRREVSERKEIRAETGVGPIGSVLCGCWKKVVMLCDELRLCRKVDGWNYDGDYKQTLVAAKRGFNPWSIGFVELCW